MIENQTDLLPRPDPTTLTTEQLHREIAALAEVFNAKMELQNEKFRGIDTQFAERDKRTEQLSLADKTAIAAALQAQKEAAGATYESITAAIAKSEVGFTKQIDGLGTLIASITAGFDSKISDLTARLDRGDGHGSGLKDGWGYIVGAGGLLLALVTFVASRLGG